ncbi:hypothetical protein RhiirA5_426918 [Rhizophagus irregularis]|uniref:Uncharacterized protein n=1 Tax=Rhizophagus irregularis TaxID=588596 RepID=A0A2N0P3B1_9GLOM|nr:hypothetical protein RhiirA5_426918 [Rhizophagus irregularis]
MTANKMQLIILFIERKNITLFWLKKQENTTSVRRRVIELAEQQNDLETYKTLNDDFTKRLEDVNRYQDGKEVGDKMPILESPHAPSRKPVLVETNENEHDENNMESEEEAEKEEETSVKQELVKITPNAVNTKKKNKRRSKKK